ncbi:Uncharacterized protein MA16_Dca005277 [Dendrobium catenatum]|uniref:PUM-HD domain-containing protein n=1 Tax=Dendrobium catenatum TaxID=906689 RepID=A0A2I0VLR2_9ASPA|nr:Uncharacterized protein MA16_Dca005277 [Dendrobium catenatum]
MSQQKFASNVIEKCLTYSSPEERQLLINEMLGSTEENEPLQAMMKDQFGNYVVQKVLETCDDRNRELILSRIKVHLNTLKRYTYGKHIVARVEKLIAAGDEGDVLYVFPKDYRSKLAAKSFRLKVEPLLDKLKGASEYVIRVSFGTALIMSIVLVYTTIIALVSSRSDDDNRGRRGGRSYDSGVTIFFNPSDLFWYWDPYYYKRRRTRTDDGMNFIESVFSFVFGDGDPNQGIEEERWKLIGQYISSNGGVVTAEELAPYLDVEPMEKSVDDDSYILPVLLRFDGHPEVDDEGNILYRFPSLQRTASSQRASRKEYVGKKWAQWVDGIQKFFEEKKWSFRLAAELEVAGGEGEYPIVFATVRDKDSGDRWWRRIRFPSREGTKDDSARSASSNPDASLSPVKTSASERAMVIGLGSLNLFGVIVLGSMLKNTTVSPSGFISFVSDIFPLLQEKFCYRKQKSCEETTSYSSRVARFKS